jgi:hypothetical protein
MAKETTQSLIKNLAERMDNGFRKVDEKFNHQGALIEDFNHKLDLVVEHVQNTDRQLGLVKETLIDHTKKFERIDARLAGIEVKLDSKADKVDFQKLDRRVVALEAA